MVAVAVAQIQINIAPPAWVPMCTVDARLVAPAALRRPLLSWSHMPIVLSTLAGTCDTVDGPLVVPTRYATPPAWAFRIRCCRHA